MKRPTRRRGAPSSRSRTGTINRKLVLFPSGRRGGWSAAPRSDEHTVLTISNRQSTLPINVRLLRQICATLLNGLLEIIDAELDINLVGADEMTFINETFLQHAGSTDVITFDYAESPSPARQTRGSGAAIHGELFICLDQARSQARAYRTTWQSEVVRYIVHGVLHLLGHDDHRADDRRKMKQEENRLLRQIALRFPLSRLAGKTRLRA